MTFFQLFINFSIILHDEHFKMLAREIFAIYIYMYMYARIYNEILDYQQ